MSEKLDFAFVGPPRARAGASIASSFMVGMSFNHGHLLAKSLEIPRRKVKSDLRQDRLSPLLVMQRGRAAPAASRYQSCNFHLLVPYAGGRPD